MDTILSIITGLGLRLLLKSLEEPLGQTAPALLGLWEGLVMHYLSYNKTTVDHYLAYGLRVMVDLFFTQNLSRMLAVLIWTTLSMVAFEAFNPMPRHGTKRRHQSTRSRSTPSHVRIFETPVTAQRRLYLHTSANINTPSQQPVMKPPSSPPSPPSFFLSNSPELTNSDRYLPSVLAGVDSDTNSPSPKYILLPTPPATLVTDGAAVNNTPTPSNRRLSTIDEISGTEETTSVEGDQGLDHLDSLKRDIGYEKSNVSHAQSVATVAPLPVPNAAIRYIEMKWEPHSSLSDVIGPDDIYAGSAVASVPLPVPNAGMRYNAKAAAHSEFDGLTTPNADDNWELTDNDDLQTPPARHKELSPLFSDQPFPINFSAMKVTNPVIAEPAGPSGSFTINKDTDSKPILPTPIPNPSNALPTPTVEYLPQPVNGPVSDHGRLSETDSYQTETDTMSVISTRNSLKLSSRAELLRNQARDAEKERSRFIKELLIATREARIRDALFLRASIRDSEIRAKKLHERAAKRFFMAHNSSRESALIDVHGLRSSEAIEMTENALREAVKHGQPRVRVIVGKGLHSQGGHPILKNAITREMEIQKISCRVDPFNPGALILSLPNS